MPAAKQVDKKTALKRITDTLGRLATDDDRRVVLDAAVAYDTATRGETSVHADHVKRGA